MCDICDICDIGGEGQISLVVVESRVGLCMCGCV